MMRRETSIRRRLTTLVGLAVIAPLFALVAGCQKPPSDGGPDADYLLATPYAVADIPDKASDHLLPLTPGTFWDCHSVSANKISNDRLTVVGPATPPGGAPSTLIELTREGAPWRREYYTLGDGDGIYETAVKDETSPLMVFSAPLPILRFGAKEGDEVTWEGTAKIGDRPAYPVSSVSRLSQVEETATKAGKFKTCRIDTIITITIDGHPIRFPSVRWLAPGVGFVRRGYADKGLPATSETTSFNVR